MGLRHRSLQHTLTGYNKTPNIDVAGHLLFTQGLGRLKVEALGTSESIGMVRHVNINEKLLANNGPRVRREESSKYWVRHVHILILLRSCAVPVLELYTKSFTIPSITAPFFASYCECDELG